MNKPKIRFKGFEGEWKERKIGDALSINSGRDYKHLEEGDIPVYGTGGYMLSVNERISDCDAIGIGRKGTIDKPQYLRAPFWTVDTLFFLIAKVGIDLDFAYNLSQVIGWRKYDESTGVPSLSKNNIEKIPISLPSLPEQRALASYFTSLDAQIAASTSRLSSLKQIKAASLLNMFPQKGETVPRVRFKGFQGEWKERKLGEVFSERVENNINGQLLSVTLNKGIIRASENGKLDNSNSDKSKYKVVNINDIAYNSMRMWQGASGCSKYEGIVSPAYTVITPKEDIDSSFFSYLFKTDIAINKFRLHSQGLTSDNWNLKYPAFSKIDVYCPLDISEQRAIASYFTALDAQITLHRERLEKLKQIKAACLEKMFA